MTDISALNAQIARLKAQVDALTSPKPMPQPRDLSAYQPISPADLAHNEVARNAAMLKSTRRERVDAYINSKILDARQFGSHKQIKSHLANYSGELATFIPFNGHEHHGILRRCREISGMWELRNKNGGLVCAFHAGAVKMTALTGSEHFKSPVFTQVS